MLTPCSTVAEVLRLKKRGLHGELKKGMKSLSIVPLRLFLRRQRVDHLTDVAGEDLSQIPAVEDARFGLFFPLRQLEPLPAKKAAQVRDLVSDVVLGVFIFDVLQILREGVLNGSVLCDDEFAKMPWPVTAVIDGYKYRGALVILRITRPFAFGPEKSEGIPVDRCDEIEKLLDRSRTMSEIPRIFDATLAG
jgi:hypothetical protein